MDAKDSTVNHARVIQLPKIVNRAGNITPINSSVDIPFAINRVYYLYDIPSGQDRGAHAHKCLYQLVIAASGSYSMELFDGVEKKKFTLNRPDKGLLIPPGLWRQLFDFSSCATCLVLASEAYDEGDYIRDYDEYIELKGV